MARRSSSSSGQFLLANRYFWVGVALLFLAGSGIYFVIDDVLMPSYTRQVTTVAVPDVRNASIQEASHELESRGLQVELIIERFNPRVPRDVVIEQSPRPTTAVKPGRRVFLTVNSSQVPMVVVPFVSDLSLREAENRLKAAGLTARDILPDTIPSPYPNTITRQSPAAGDSLARGSGVTLWYSTGFGEAQVTVPDVTGFTVADAEAQLLNLKLRPVLVVGGSGEEDLSGRNVLRQSRDAGSQVREGTEVRLFLDEAEEPPEVDVPPLPE